MDRHQFGYDFGFRDFGPGLRRGYSSVANQGSVDSFLICPSNLWENKIVWADGVKFCGLKTRGVGDSWQKSFDSETRSLGNFLCLNFWKLLFRTLLDELNVISSLLETMDANDFGSVNARKSLWLILARFLAERGWERYEWPMRWWKKWTQWPLGDPSN